MKMARLLKFVGDGIDSVCSLVEEAIFGERARDGHPDKSATHEHQHATRGRYSVEQKPEGSRMANLHVQQHIICIHLH